jgi:hypothetical protein
VTKNNDCDDKLFGCNEDCKHCRSDGQMGGARKISELSGGFGTGLEDEAYFGSAIASLGDVNGDGVADLAVGAPGTISAPGVLWIVFLQADGSVLSKRKLNAETLELGASFTGRVGASVAALGDLDSDGVPDLAVGAPMYSPPEDQPGPRHPGRVWILRLTREGGVKGSKILEAVNTECSQTFYDMEFGAALLGLGDIDADGIGDLAIGQLIMCKGNKGMPGGVIVHRLAADGSSRGIEVTDPELTFDGSGFGNRFGAALSAAGDVNGDGVPDLAIGSPEGGDSDPTLATRGNLWIALLNRTGAVTGQPIRLSSANLGQSVERPSAQLGRALAWLGDSDGNGLPELAIGMPESSEICLLERSDPMTAFKFSRWLSTRDQTIPVAMAPDAQLAAAITPIGDYNGDGLDDLAVGAPMADDGGQDRGALWLLSLTLDCGRAPARDCDGNAANGCETPIGTTENCGACRQNCMTLPHTAGERACRDGACTFACEAGFVDCNKRKPDGCELVTTPGFYPQSLGASCVNDRPVLRCADGYGDCNGRADDGCEVELLTSGLHCGACDQACGHIKGVAAECVSGQCRINAEQPQCDYGYVDCNENPSDGCEGCGTCSNLCGPDELCERGARDGDVPVCVGTSQCDSIRVGTCRDDSPCTTPLTTERDCGACGIGCGIWDYKRLCGLNDRGDGYTCR